MLDDSLKSQIQTAYSTLLENRGFRPRYCQRLMIGTIARTLGGVKEVDADTEADIEAEREEEMADTDEDSSRTDVSSGRPTDQSGSHIAVIEAGTGTGKTVAYLLATLPVARAQNKRLIISTATVALQEQIVYTDLPDILKGSGLEFSYALAKGRRRYLCLSRLDQILQESGPQNQSLAFFTDVSSAGGSGEEPVPEDYIPLFETMLDSYARGDWEGDRDSWPSEVDDFAWNRVSTDHVQCTNRKCSHFDSCCFYRAREQIQKVDCIVTNHDLVLADLLAGGGGVLPEPSEAIYVFDEGHHLPDKAINHLANNVLVRNTRSWLDTITPTLQRLDTDKASEKNLSRRLPEIENLVGQGTGYLEDLSALLDDFVMEAGDGGVHRFAMGAIPESIAGLSASLALVFEKLFANARRIHQDLESDLADESRQELVEPWVPIVAAMAARLESAMALWQDYAGDHYTGKQVSSRPYARWLTFRDSGNLPDVLLSSCPVAVDDMLASQLWEQCHAAVVTSATLSVGGDFSRFGRSAGIPASSEFIALPSPFDHQRQAQLVVPDLGADPRDPESHSQAIAGYLEALPVEDGAILVLFTSWRLMNLTIDHMNAVYLDRVLPQGSLSRTELIREHKQRIDQGKSSTVFGLASFAEGIDLPGKYCRHVVITKLPFSVPDDPVEATLCEWISANGGNPFQEISIPDAILRITQAAGRLLRTEEDTGTISILDRRVVSQYYGKRILDALPPFRRVVE